MSQAPKSIMEEMEEAAQLAKEIAPIEDFSISIKSIDMAEIYYNRGEREFTQKVEIEVDYCAGEKPSYDSPGEAESGEITSVFGLSVEERYHWDKFLLEHDIEAMLFEVVAENRTADAADYADMVHQQDKDRKAEEYYESQALSQPEPINNYSEKRE
jgi:hypothetical protein